MPKITLKEKSEAEMAPGLDLTDEQTIHSAFTCQHMTFNGNYPYPFKDLFHRV